MSHHCVAVVSTFLQPTENISQLSKNAAAKPYYKLSLDAQDLRPPDNKIFYHDMIHRAATASLSQARFFFDGLFLIIMFLIE